MTCILSPLNRLPPLTLVYNTYPLDSTILTGFMDEIDDRGLNGNQFSMSMSNADVHGGSKQKAGTWGSRSLGGSSTGNRADDMSAK